MALLDYNFYVGTYYGIGILAEDWPRLSTRADDELAAMERKYTITGTEEQRNKAICAIADELYSRDLITSAAFAVDESGSVGTTRVSIGSVSTSAESVTAASLGVDLTESGLQEQIYNLIGKYMDIYRGIPERRSCRW